LINQPAAPVLKAATEAGVLEIVGFLKDVHAFRVYHGKWFSKKKKTNEMAAQIYFKYVQENSILELNTDLVIKHGPAIVKAVKFEKKKGKVPQNIFDLLEREVFHYFVIGRGALPRILAACMI